VAGARADRFLCDGTWQVVNSPNPGVTNILYGMTSAGPTDVWAVGYELPAPGSFFRPLIEHWDGQSWAVVTAPTVDGGNTYLFAVAAVSSADVWAVGSSFNTNGTQQHPLVEHWDGSAWTIVPTALRGYSGQLVEVTAIGPDDVWAVGSMTRIGDTRSLALAEHWDGTRWSPVRTPNGPPLNRDAHGLAALDRSHVWLSGVVSDGSTDRLLTDRWNGVRWSSVPAPDVPGSSTEVIRGMTGSAAAGAWIVGAYVASPPFRVPLTVRWNGSGWQQIPTPPPPSGAFITDLEGVAAPAAADAWSVGYTWNGHSDAYILHWDGTSWSEAPRPPVPWDSSQLEAVWATSSTDVWAAGFGDLGDFTGTLFEHYCA
jgi:hypothetical protein